MRNAAHLSPGPPISPQRWLTCAGLALLWGLLCPAPAPAIDCGTAPGFDIRFTPLPGDSPAPRSCGDTLRCHQPKDLGPFIQLVDSGCDPAAGPCAIQLRAPVEFPGNEQNIAEVGSVVSPVIYWFTGGTPPSSCQPWFNVDCGQIAICGVPGARILTDFTETFLNLGTVSCSDLSNPLLGTYSISGFTCTSRFSCPKRLDVTLPATPDAVRQALGCAVPPEEKCNGDAECRSCLIGGVGAGGGPPGNGGPGGDGGENGDGAHLYYAGGGAGHPNFPGSAAWNVTLGRYWSHDYALRIVPAPDESHVWLITQFGTFREWSAPDAGGVYQTVSPSNEYRTLTSLGAGAGWTLRELDGTVHAFGADGRWLSTTDRNGNAKAGTYGAGGELASVAFPDGTREDFGYHLDGKLAAIAKVGVDGTTTRQWDYTWTGDDLTRVDRPDGTAILYTYGDARFPGYLTRIELEADPAKLPLGEPVPAPRVERGYEYDAAGNVIRTWRGDVSATGPDAVDVWSFAYDDPALPTTTTVTDPLGAVSTYEVGRDAVSSNVKVVSISGDCPTCGLGPNAQLFYEDPAHPLRPTRTVDGRGITTLLSYDAHGQLSSRTEALATPEERTTTWTYDATFPALVTAIERPSVAGGAATRRTDWILDAQGNATDRTISGVEAGSAFAYTTTSTFNGAGQPLSVDPPGHGTADTTSYTYDPARGDLVATTRTDPIVGTTTFGHDPFNRPTSEVDVNGVETTTAYDPLDRVTEVREVGASAAEDLVTASEYGPFGDLLRTTLPAGNVVEYGYDAAGRLVSIERKPDAETPGERVLYTLDAVGNRIREEQQRWDTGTAAWVTEAETGFVYSTRCRVDRVIQAPGAPEEAVTEYAYDCNGNLERVWDPNHPRFVEPPPPPPPPPPDGDGSPLVVVGSLTEEPATAVYAYDALDRLATVTQPWGGAAGGVATTTYGYDVQSHLTSVTDAEGNLTSYAYSDRDLLTEETSPVAGTTTHAYDEHGELLSTTDARGVTVLRTVDALDRVTLIDYVDPDLDTSFVYDAAPAACATSSPVGRLASITRGTTTIDYCHDRFGRVTRDGQLVFGYDENGNRTQVEYPGGVVATYTHDFADREADLTVQVGSGTPQAVVTAASYLPGGPLSSLGLGNGLTEARAFDRRYVPTAITVAGVFDRSYTTDAVGNVTGIDVVTPAASFPAIYAYQDIQYYLIQGGGPWGQRTWSYDRIGNRVVEETTSDADNGPSTYTYAVNPGGGNTPKLLRIDELLDDEAGSFLEYGYDLAGNQTSVLFGNLEGPGPQSLLGYDEASRLAELARTGSTGTTAVTYDGRSLLAVSELTFAGSTDFERTEAVYDSTGVLYSRHYHKEVTVGSGGDGDEGGGPVTDVFDETNHVLHFAGRPVAELTVPQTPVGSPALVFVTTDHLGAPVLLSDAVGAEVWLGGMDPWGSPYQLVAPGGGDDPPGGDGDGLTAGPQGAGPDGPRGPRSLHARAAGFPASGGTFLRLPGQWDDPTFNGAAGVLGGIFYNVHRWYQPGIGRYTRPDPLPMEIFRETTYAYVSANPLVATDPLGLAVFKPCSELPAPKACECDKEGLAKAAQTSRKFRDEFCAYRNRPERPPGVPKEGQRGAQAVGKIDPALGPVYRPQGDPCRDFCICEHERQHATDLKSPKVDRMILDGVPRQQTVNWLECRAYHRGTFCLQGFARGGSL